jgi:23S rRNA (uracil1939-C5)-methyltransferase
MSDDDLLPLTLHPRALDDAGAGVAEAHALRIHVAGALPNETITARVVHRSPHGPDAWADLQEILVASPQRVAPACPAYGQCGGCLLQHLAPAGQLAWKRSLVVSAFAAQPASSGLPKIADGVAACVASPRSLGYRNQAKYVVGRDADGRTILGGYAPRSHHLIDLAGCRLGEPPQDEVARQLCQLLDREGVEPFDERTRTGLLRYVVVRTNAAGEALVALVTARPELPQGARLAEALAAAVPAVVTVVHEVNDSPGNAIFARGGAGLQRTLLGPGVLRERFGQVAIEIGARAFLQLNREVAQAAYAAIGRALGPDPIARLFDLYAGVGAIAFSLAGAAREIVAVEENPTATSAGQLAAARAGQTHIRFVTVEVATAMGGLGNADAVVLNPPRAGAGARVSAAIAAMRPRIVAYLSCNPTTLAKDLAVLTAPGSFLTVESVQPFDMLPHTAHVETLAILRRSAEMP